MTFSFFHESRVPFSGVFPDPQILSHTLLKFIYDWGGGGGSLAALRQG
jgi:hypothetical protein